MTHVRIDNRTGHALQVCGYTDLTASAPTVVVTVLDELSRPSPHELRAAVQALHLARQYTDTIAGRVELSSVITWLDRLIADRSESPL